MDSGLYEDYHVKPVYGRSVLMVSNAPRVSVSVSTETRVRPNSPIPVAVTFSEPVLGFTIDGIIAASGSVSNFTGSGAVYTFDVTPDAIGEVAVDIAAGAATDADGYSNMPAPTLSLGIPYDDEGDAGISKDKAITAVIDYFPDASPRRMLSRSSFSTSAVDYPEQATHWVRRRGDRILI